MDYQGLKSCLLPMPSYLSVRKRWKGAFAKW
jgi:hypothetical protein